MDPGGSRTDSEDASSSHRTSKLGNMNNNNSLNYPPPPESQSADLLQAPATDFASPASSSLNKPTVGSERKSYCMPCIGKWVSDMSELESFDISRLVEYLREEFQSMHFKKAEEKLRLLEEEEVKQKEGRLYVEYLEEELRVYKDKYSDLSMELGKFESTEVELMECKLKCEDLSEKVMYLEKANADKDREITVLRTNYQDSEHVRETDVLEKDDFEFDLEPEMCLQDYILKVREASKAKKRLGKGIEKVKGKMKSRKLVEIVAKNFTQRQKRSRRSGGSVLGGEGKKNNGRKRNRNGKAEKEDVKAKGNNLEERKTKRMKRNHGAPGNHVSVKTKNLAIAMTTRTRIFEESKKKNMKRNRQALGKVVNVKTNKGAIERAVNSVSTVLEESEKKNMKRTSVALDEHADVTRKNRAVEEAKETRSNSLAQSNKKSTKRSPVALDKQVDVKMNIGAVEEPMQTRNRSLIESAKKSRQRSRTALDKRVYAKTKNRAVEDAVKAKSVILENPGISRKRKFGSNGANIVKNSSSTNGRSVGGASCHQCKTRRVEILSCMNCKRRYCFLCMRNRYPQMSHGEIEKSCPACRGNCNCKACLRKMENIR